MNSNEINGALRNDSHTRSCFQGVYPSDKLPKESTSYPAAFVANVDRSHEPGSHWIAFYFDEHGDGEFFDPYGMRPLVAAFEKFLQHHTKGRVKYNDVQLQSLFSTMCGAYVIFYIMHRARGFSMETIVNMFDPRDQVYNDRHIRQFIMKHTNRHYPLFDSSLVSEQLARAYYDT